MKEKYFLLLLIFLSGQCCFAQADTVSLKSKEGNCRKGMILAIVQSSGKKGDITLFVNSPNLPPPSIVLKTKD